MSKNKSQKSFWWYFIRVVLFTLVFLITILLLSDWNYGINKIVGPDADLSTIKFWLVVLLYISLAFGFMSMITVLVMKIVKLTK